jgi:hypothetical protein
MSYNANAKEDDSTHNGDTSGTKGQIANAIDAAHSFTVQYHIHKGQQKHYSYMHIRCCHSPQTPLFFSVPLFKDLADTARHIIGCHLSLYGTQLKLWSRGLTYPDYVFSQYQYALCSRITKGNTAAPPILGQELWLGSDIRRSPIQGSKAQIQHP